MNTSITTPRGTVTIRAATVEDAPSRRELRLEALRNHPEVFSAEYAVALARPMSFWEDQLKAAGTPDSAKIYMAWQENEPLGSAGLALNDSSKTRHSANIVGMYVRPAWRGLGIADGLIAACLDWARAHEITIVKLAVVATNVRAIRCYQRCGFQVYGTEPQALYYDGVYYDEVLMSRQV